VVDALSFPEDDLRDADTATPIPVEPGEVTDP
jgi:hypothetical protein